MLSSIDESTNILQMLSNCEVVARNSFYKHITIHLNEMNNNQIVEELKDEEEEKAAEGKQIIIKIQLWQIN